MHMHMHTCTHMRMHMHMQTLMRMRMHMQACSTAYQLAFSLFSLEAGAHLSGAQLGGTCSQHSKCSE